MNLTTVPCCRVADFIGAFPFDTIFRLRALTLTGGSATTLFITADSVRILRLSRVARVATVVERVKEAVARISLMFPPFDPISQMATIILSIGVISHVMACLLYFVGHMIWDDAVKCSTHGALLLYYCTGCGCTVPPRSA